MQRFYAQRDPEDPRYAVLDREEWRHAGTVLRLKSGEAVALNLDGRLYRSVFSDENRFPVGDLLPDPEADLRITLFQGIPKGDKMEWIVQKCTEMGVHAVVPVEMERCVSRWDAKSIPRKTERLNRIAREAAKQSGRSLAPEVEPPLSFSALTQRLSGFDGVLIPWENAEGFGPAAYWRSLESRPRTLALVIGPEGGMEEKEVTALCGAGGRVITLGRRILRTETAGLCALTALMALSGNMD